jgi:hypothetical protein
VRKRRQSRPKAAAATIPNATGCCQSIHAQDNPESAARNREFLELATEVLRHDLQDAQGWERLNCC